MPYSLKKLKGFFEVYNIHTALSDAVQLIYKSEFESAAREAFVAIWAVLYAIIATVQFVIAHWIWFAIGAAILIAAGIAFATWNRKHKPAVF